MSLGKHNSIIHSVLKKFFLSGNKKLHQKSELAVKADHVLKFVYDAELIQVQGRIRASISDKNFHVKVCTK